MASKQARILHAIYCYLLLVQVLIYKNKLGYRRETTLQGALVLAKSGRMGLGD